MEAYLTNGCKECEENAGSQLSVLLNGLLPKKITEYLLRQTGGALKDQIRRICEEIKQMSVPITKTASFTQAQTTTGGVRVSEICPETMGSRLAEGLYFAGEMIDLDGACGGYNLQWAWSSGHLAASSAVDYVRERN